MSSLKIINHIDTINGMNVERRFITGDSIGELHSHLMKLVRPQSRNFYHREITADLSRGGVAFGDQHAFNGVRVYGILKGSDLKEMSERVKEIYLIAMEDLNNDW